MNMKPYLLALPSLLLAACGGGGGSDDPEFADAAVVAVRASNYSSGAVSLVQTESPFTAQNNLTPNDSSDLAVRSDGDHYFLIEKYGSNRISRFEAGNTTPIYTYATQSAEETNARIQSNPYDIVVASATKAYLLRYGSSKIWIVNPTAANEASFKTGEIDLAAYDSDGVPEIAAGLIKDGKLYVAMQRLQFFSATQDSYVAVIDTATNTEIQAAAAGSELKGIRLPIRNVGSLVAVPGSSAILAIGVGATTYNEDYTVSTPAYDGGIASINSSSYAATLLVDDGDATTHPYGQFGDLAVVASDRAYFIGSTGFAANQTLYRFNPSSASPTPVAVSGYGPLELGSLAVDPNGNLWVSRTGATAPGLSVLGFSGGTETTIKALIDTVLTPINIDFVTVPLS